MIFERRFSIAPAFVRLIRRDRPGIRIVEGHFPDQPERRSHVRLENESCELVLESVEDGRVTAEERTEVSRAQGEVLLDVCAGKVSYERLRIDLSEDVVVLIERVLTPAPSQTARIAFQSAEAAEAFRPPLWLGPELKADEAAGPRAVALGARPKAYDGPLSNAGLESLLDLLERSASQRYGARGGRDDLVMSALKRLARGDGAPAPQASVSAAPAPAPAPMPPPAAIASEDALFDPPPELPAGPTNGSGRRPA